MNDSIFSVIRTIHYASTLIPAGILLFLLLVARPAFALKNAQHALAERIAFAALELRLLRLAFWCIPLSLLSAFAWFWIVAAGMADDSFMHALQFPLFETVFTKTQFGEIWGIRFIIGFCFLLLLWISARSAEKRSEKRLLSQFSLIANAIAACALLVLIAFAGHAAASHKPWFTLSSDMLHLLAVSAWPTGLLPLAIFLWLSKNEPALQKMALVLTRRFSSLSIIAVSLIVVSGLVNSYFLVAHFSALWTTNYGRLLSLKLICFLVMLGIGFRNLISARFSVSISPKLSKSDSEQSFPPAIYRRVILEILIAFLIIIIVSVLGLTPPAMHHG